MTTYIITDTFNKEVVANRKTLNAAKKWAASLNVGLKGVRYVVGSKVV